MLFTNTKCIKFSNVLNLSVQLFARNKFVCVEVCCSCRYVSSYENDELKPYVEPEPDLTDHKRIEALVCLGYTRTDIEASLDSAKYDDVFATYLLLGRKSTDVSILRIIYMKLNLESHMKFDNHQQ